MSADTATTRSIRPRFADPATSRMILVAAGYLLVVVSAAVIPLVSTRNPFLRVTPEYQAYRLALWLVWLIVLIESMRRQPTGRLWKLIFLYVCAEQVWAFGYIHDSTIWSLSLLLGSMYVPIFIHMILSFPTGRLVASWDRAIAAFYYLEIVVFSLINSLVFELPLDACKVDCLRNVFLTWPSDDVYAFIQVASLLIPVAAAPLIVIRLWRHWLNATPVGRRVILPVLIAVPIAVVTIALQYAGTRFEIEPLNDFFATGLQPIPLFVLPIGLLIGILRLRLDRGRTAELLVELGRGVPVGGLRDVLARALGDPTLQLAFASPTGDGFVDGAGRPVVLPDASPTTAVTRLEHDGELLGVLIHDPAIDDEDPGLVEAVGSAASLALENERLAAQVRAQLEEVRASRARIVEAGDAERRRVERDLHDGAQQRLVALAVRLQVAKETTSGASELLDEATMELQTAIDEVRVLARGLHPPVLTEAGLGAAVEGLAERAPLTVIVDVPESRFAPPIEATAYFVIAEALTNVARHAEATEAEVTVVERDGRLVITVRDDGRGGADPSAGSGLSGLSDRLAAAGGTLKVESVPGRGTTLTAELPLS
jgi:signal transduction histidine kinase